MRPNIGPVVDDFIAPEIQAPIIRNNTPSINTTRVRCQPISKQRFSSSHINTACSLPRRFKKGIGHNGIAIRFMRRDIEVQVVVEPRVDSPAVFPPASLTLKVEYVVFKHGIQRSAVLTKYLDIIVLTHIVRIIIDINMVCRPLTFKAIEVNAFPIVLADIVAYKHITRRPFHNTAKPEIIMTVVILNIGVAAVIVCIKGTPVYSTFSDISVYFVILDLDATGVKAEYAVARTVAAAVCQSIVLVHSILAGPSYNAVSTRMVYEITGYIDPAPEIIFTLILWVSIKNYLRMRGAITNSDSPDSLYPVANYTEIMKFCGLFPLHAHMNRPLPATFPLTSWI